MLYGLQVHHTHGFTIQVRGMSNNPICFSKLFLYKFIVYLKVTQHAASSARSVERLRLLQEASFVIHMRVCPVCFDADWQSTVQPMRVDSLQYNLCGLTVYSTTYAGWQSTVQPMQVDSLQYNLCGLTVYSTTYAGWQSTVQPMQVDSLQYNLCRLTVYSTTYAGWQSTVQPWCFDIRASHIHTNILLMQVESPQYDLVDPAVKVCRMWHTTLHSSAYMHT